MSDLLSSRFPLRLLALIGASITVFILVGARPAHAAFPGLNGKITFDRYTEGPTSGNPLVSPRSLHIRRPAPRGVNTQSDQIYTINPDGSGETNVSNSNRLDEYANFSADGQKLLFDDWSGGNDQMWSMNADGSNQADLTNDTSAYDDLGTWSPDGTRIAFVRTSDTTGNDEIWVMNADGSNPHLLITAAANMDDEDPNWSPDGTKIAFDREGQGTSQIYVANADGSGTPGNVSNNADEDLDPNWSPDGTKLAFEKSIDNEADQIWVMNADGSTPHEVAGGATADDEAPAWSPDGTMIVYQHATVETIKQAIAFGRTIWIVGADGSNDHQFTNPPAPFEDYQPDWQPVGSPVSAASFPTGCTATGSVVVHAADPTHFISPLGVHYKVDGGADQGVAADANGNVTIPVANGKHTVEYWASDAAGYLEAAHHTGTLTVDTVNKCVPPAPKVAVAGVRRACVAKAFRIRVNISTVGKPKSVRVFLGKKRLVSTTKTSFTLKINPKKLAHRTRLRIVAISATGKATTINRTITRCAVAKPRRHAAPRFTG